MVRVKDSNGHAYSIPLYSTLQIGMVQELAGEGGKSSTSQKTTKVADILLMKVSIPAGSLEEPLQMQRV